MTLLKRAVIETESGSQYEIVRENGSKDSSFLISKLPRKNLNNWLIFIGHFKASTPGILMVTKGFPQEDQIYVDFKGVLPDILDSNINSIIGERLFYLKTNLKTMKNLQRAIYSITKNVVRSRSYTGGGIPKEIVNGLSNTTYI